MSQLDDEALASFNEVFATEAPDEGPPSADPTDEAPSEPEATADPEPDDVPRDEKGRFAPKQDTLYAGKYKSPEELEKAYLEAQRALGSYKGEVGELRQTLEDRLDALQRTQPTAQIDADLIERNPGAVAQQIAVQAFQAGQDPEQHPAYDAVMEEWYDQNPRQATRFELTLQQVRTQAALEQATKPVQQTLQEQQNQLALQSFVRDNPDLPDYLDEIQQIAAQPGHELLSNALLSENPADRVSALGVLYKLAKATAAPARATPQAVEQAAQATAADIERAVADAAVINTANANQGDPPVKDEVERMWEEWQTFGVSHLK